MSTPLAAIAEPLPASARPSRRDVLWEHCRNNLGIARLLVQEARPQPFVVTACAMAVESACRAALERTAFAFDGDVEGALRRLGAPRDLWLDEDTAPAAVRLASAERVVRWIADYLRREAPERSWGC